MGPAGPVGGSGDNLVFDQPPINNMQPYGVVNYIIALTGVFPSRSSTQPLLGEIFMFAGNFAPRGFALCDGQLLTINNNQALFSILGTTYGGDGRTTFGLPDLRGRAVLHEGQGPGLTNRRLGEIGGSETSDQPGHTHGHSQ
jgi:microcystin-dependent protein